MCYLADKLIGIFQQNTDVASGVATIFFAFCLLALIFDLFQKDHNGFKLSSYIFLVFNLFIPVEIYNI